MVRVFSTFFVILLFSETELFFRFSSVSLNFVTFLFVFHLVKYFPFRFIPFLKKYRYTVPFRFVPFRFLAPGLNLTFSDLNFFCMFAGIKKQKIWAYYVFRKNRLKTIYSGTNFSSYTFYHSLVNFCSRTKCLGLMERYLKSEF
jgi:hypothetical protein